LRIQLACVLLDEYHITSDFKSLSAAIKLLEECLSVSSIDDATRIHAKIKLGQVLFELFRVTERIEDVRGAIASLEHVVHAPVDTASELQRCLALSILAIYKSGGLVTRALKLSAEDLPLLEQAIIPFDPITQNWDQRPVYLVARASLSFSQATTTKDLKYVDDGIRFSELVVRDYSPTHPSFVQALFFVVKLSLLRGRLTADQSYIEKALGVAERAASGQIAMSPVDRAYALYDWARCRIDVAHRKGDLTELESALEVLESALDVCPNPHWNRKVIIETMSWGYGAYFEHSGQVKALDKIIGLPQYSQELVYSYPFFAANVAEAMILRARTTPSATSRYLLKEAVRIVTARMNYYLPLQRTAETWERTELNAKLCQATLFLEEVDGGSITTIDLNTMLRLARESVDYSIPQQRPPATILLCQLLLHQGRALHNLEMVQEAEGLLSESIANEATNRIYCTELLATQALALTTRSTLVEDDQLLDEVWRKYEEAVGDISGRPRERFFAALKWANCAQERGIQTMALTAYRHAIELLPRLAYLGHDIIGQLEILREINGLASAAATVALSLGQVQSAIEMLEQSRGIHWNRELQLRPPTDQLPEDVKKQLDQICRSLNDEGLTAAGRREKAEELNVILRHIRSTAGTERFLLAPTIQDLNLITRDLQATLAVIIPGETGCYAILIGVSNDPKSIRLSITASRLEEMTKRVTSLQSIVGVRRRDSRKVQFSALQSSQESIYSSYLNEILSELWETVARPILGALKLEVCALCSTCIGSNEGRSAHTQPWTAQTTNMVPCRALQSASVTCSGSIRSVWSS
jgi:tetratricopeptide (TPR) repeat protein